MISAGETLTRLRAGNTLNGLGRLICSAPTVRKRRTWAAVARFSI